MQITDEMVERAAEAMWNQPDSTGEIAGPRAWADTPDDDPLWGKHKGDYRMEARAALTAALGDVEPLGYEERDGRKFYPDMYTFLNDTEAHVEYLEERIALLQRSYIDVEENLIAAERERVPGVSVEKWQRIYRSDLHEDDREAIRAAVANAREGR